MATKTTTAVRRFPGKEAPQPASVSELIAYFNEYEAAIGVKSLHREGIPLRTRSRHRTQWTLSDGNSRAQTGIVDEREDDVADVAEQRKRTRRSRRALSDEAPDMNDGLTARPRGGTAVACNVASYDKLAEQVPMLTASKRVYRALLWMIENGQSLYVTVLWRLYGPRWWGKHTTFGDLAPLVTYTAAAEEAREEMALEVSTERETATAIGTREMHAVKRHEIEEAFWMAAGSLNVATRDLARGKKKEDHARVRHAQRRIAATLEFLGGLIAAFAYDGVLRARLGVMTAVDRGLDADDAIQWKLRAPPAYLTPEDKSEWSDARVRFVSSVHTQAYNLRRDAHEAYRNARAITGIKPDRPRRLSFYSPPQDEAVKHDVSGASP